NCCELVGLSFSVEKGQAWYVPASADQKEAHALVQQFKPVFENPAIGKIGQNLKFDILVLSWYDVKVAGELFDTMLAHYLIDPETRHGMDVLSENYLGYTPVSITTLIGPKGKGQLNMLDVDPKTVGDYAAED